MQQKVGTLPIITFEPIFKSVLWGGTRIAEFKGLPPQGESIGEAWDLSPMENRESIVASGPLKGYSINELTRLYGTGLCGKIPTERYGHRFPLLIKWIDSNADLSIQVHPDGALSAKRHNACGKTEMWYCVDTRPGAYLYNGFNREITQTDFKDAVAAGRVIDLLGKYNPVKGDVFFIPAGRVHSLGAGNLILEIQEASDITYRIYDYDRVDTTGQPRKLHIEESLDAIDYTASGSCIEHVSPVADSEVTMQECPQFTATLLNPVSPMHVDLSERDSFTIFIVVEGSASLIDPDGNSTPLMQGHTALVPASMPSVDIIPVSDNCRIVTVYVI